MDSKKFFLFNRNPRGNKGKRKCYPRLQELTHFEKSPPPVLTLVAGAEKQISFLA